MSLCKPACVFDTFGVSMHRCVCVCTCWFVCPVTSCCLLFRVFVRLDEWVCVCDCKGVCICVCVFVFVKFCVCKCE